MTTKYRYGGKFIAYFKITSGILIFLMLAGFAFSLATLVKGNIFGILMIGSICLYIMIRGYQISHFATIEGVRHLKTLKSGKVFNKEKLLEFELKPPK